MRKKERVDLQWQLDVIAGAVEKIARVVEEIKGMLCGMSDELKERVSYRDE